MTPPSSRSHDGWLSTTSRVAPRETDMANLWACTPIAAVWCQRSEFSSDASLQNPGHALPLQE